MSNRMGASSAGMSMVRAAAGSLVVGALLIAMLLSPGLSSAAAANGRRSHKDAGLCPKKAVLSLSRNGVGMAVFATLRHVARENKNFKPVDHSHPVPTGGARVTASVLATGAGVRGSTVKHQCGRRLWRRTVVVYVFLPKLKFSASLSSQVFFVSRFKHGYRVWEQIH